MGATEDDASRRPVRPSGVCSGVEGARAHVVAEARLAARTLAQTYAVPIPAARTKTIIAITSACCGWLKAEKKLAIDRPIRFGADGPVRYGTVKLPRT